MGTLYVRGVDDIIIQKLHEEAKRCGYEKLGDFLNVIFEKIKHLDEEDNEQTTI